MNLKDWLARATKSAQQRWEQKHGRGYLAIFIGCAAGHLLYAVGTGHKLLFGGRLFGLTGVVLLTTALEFEAHRSDPKTATFLNVALLSAFSAVVVGFQGHLLTTMTS